MILLYLHSLLQQPLVFLVTASDLLRFAATTYPVCGFSDETGQSQPLNSPFSKGEIKANRLSQLIHKSTAIHRKELVAQS